MPRASKEIERRLCFRASRDATHRRRLRAFRCLAMTCSFSCSAMRIALEGPQCIRDLPMQFVNGLKRVKQVDIDRRIASGEIFLTVSLAFHPFSDAFLVLGQLNNSPGCFLDRRHDIKPFTPFRDLKNGFRSYLLRSRVPFPHRFCDGQADPSRRDFCRTTAARLLKCVHRAVSCTLLMDYSLLTAFQQ